MQRFLCDKCECIIHEGQETEIKIRGMQNYTVHMCLDCLEKLSFFKGDN